MITVKLKKPTLKGRLFPRYDYEAGILEVSSQEQLDWPYGIDIDGNIIFDLDAEKILVNFDLLIDKNLWEKGEVSDLPVDVREADLQFTDDSIGVKSFNFPVVVKASQEQSLISIFFPHEDRDVCWVKLSDLCYAKICENTLAGFIIKIYP